MINLTKMEIKILNAMRNNEFEDCIDAEATWTFAVIDESKINPKQARGVISSLIKKKLIWCISNGQSDDCIGFTDTGRQLFDDANGNECYWGGPKLLKERE